MDACGVSMKSKSFVSVASTSFSAAFGYDDSIKLSISKLSSISGFLAPFCALWFELGFEEMGLTALLED